MGCCGPSPLEKLSCPQSSSSSFPRYAIHNAGPVPINQVLNPQRWSSAYTPGTPSTTLVQCLYPRYSIHNAGPVPIPQVLHPQRWSSAYTPGTQLSSGLVQLPTELVQFLSHVLSYPQIRSSFYVHRYVLSCPVSATGTELSAKLVQFLHTGTQLYSELVFVRYSG
jgi:hypothetical protein